MILGISERKYTPAIIAQLTFPVRASTAGKNSIRVQRVQPHAPISPRVPGQPIASSASAQRGPDLLHPRSPCRFNRAADLINEIQNGNFDLPREEALSRIYIWLRYSSTRHLTWQRNYNTQPRILSAAQDRLTGTIAAAHGNTSGECVVCRAWPA